MSEYIPIFDADNHLYETKEAVTKYLPDRYKHLVQYVELNGKTKIAVNGSITEFIANPTFERVARPGALEDYYRHGNPEGKELPQINGRGMDCLPGFKDPAARLELMDELGIERTLMFPTLASLLEERLKDDLEAMHAVVHSLNEWLFETWQFNYEGKDRIFTTPVITLPIVEKAIEELEWVIERGAKAILIRPAPVPDHKGSRSFSLPEFDPFWAKVVEHDILVCFHSSDSGISRYTNEWNGSKGQGYALGAALTYLHLWRPVEDAIGSMVCHGTFSRFPTLKVAIVENGSGWIGPLMTALKGVYKKRPQDFREDPVMQIKRNVHISPFWEEDLNELADLLGEDRVLFGSDYPHPEGLAEPRSYLKDLEGVPEARVRKIMGENLARLMNVDQPALV